MFRTWYTALLAFICLGSGQVNSSEGAGPWEPGKGCLPGQGCRVFWGALRSCPALLSWPHKPAHGMRKMFPLGCTGQKAAFKGASADGSLALHPRLVPHALGCAAGSCVGHCTHRPTVRVCLWDVAAVSPSWDALSSSVPRASPRGDGTTVPSRDRVAGPCAELSLET